MQYVSEDVVVRLVRQDEVTRVIEAVYIEMARGSAVNFPIVRETLGYADAIFGFKSGFARSGPSLGVKAGGLWPGNRARGLANHQSTIVLFDCETGSPMALVRGTHLTALRTAAASAISIRHLARADAGTIGILGAGGQALAQLRAALPLRPFHTLFIADQSETAAKALALSLSENDIDIRLVSVEDMARNSDVIITVTPSFRPVIQADWVRRGTHLACMGADTQGKQEVAADLVASARLFVDDRAQALSIGECQHAHSAKLIGPDDLTLIGEVLDNVRPGRRNADDITLFDSTGVGLQDIAAGLLALELAVASSDAILLP
jgi:ornithine cyclodeaminase